MNFYTRNERGDPALPLWTLHRTRLGLNRSLCGTKYYVDNEYGIMAESEAELIQGIKKPCRHCFKG